MLLSVYFLCIVSVFDVKVYCKSACSTYALCDDGASELRPLIAQYTNGSSSTTQSATSSPADLVSSSTSSPFYSISTSDEFLSIYTFSSVLTIGTYRSTEIATEAEYINVYAKSQNGTWGPTQTLTFVSDIEDAAYSSSVASQSSVEASRESADNVVSASCVSAASAYSAFNATNSSYTAPIACCRPIEPCFIYADQVEIIYFANGTTNNTGNLTYSQASTFVSNEYTL